MSATKSAAVVATLSASTKASYKTLILEQRENILCITINRPQVRNALDRHALYEIMRALHYAKSADTITMVVLTGVGDVFCAGSDLSQIERYNDPHEYFKGANWVLRFFLTTFVFFPKLLVAVVNGPCIGAGFTICGLCDIVYCTETAYFEAPFSKLGICPELGSSYLFPMILGRAKATDVLVFGEKLTAQEALQFNFVAGVYKRNEVNELLWPKLLQHSKLPKESLRISKKLLRVPDREAVLKAAAVEFEELRSLRYGEIYLKAIERFLKKNKNSKL
ncbi:enoyl-CoA delta isomerase 2-like [Teleopsis dalmanni]|uniref:enoyl-CoA delta isomerase 2-like n=1 Tax=Teleopsis dalmanni TaxID=139649 RepID=UPI0018CF7A58|nr:enoyl-CoA delta isomerase 2-like [Teleopsis dalmanni]